ncbi:MAG: YqeG family HAD IIIA-type phosphatase [Candidatus Coprovivens sp.]
MKELLPKIYKKDVYDINYESLKEKGIKYLFFDMDNTLIDNTTTIPSKKLLSLINKLNKMDFKLIIISNALPGRLRKFISHIKVLDSIYFAAKPLKKNYLKLIDKHKIKKEEIACIGDQIFTDIKGANKLNLLSILVDPISKKEHIITKFNRLKERKIYKHYLKRGEYYE